MVSAPKRPRFKEHDKFLKQFEYSKALDSVLRRVGFINLNYFFCSKKGC